MSNSSCEICHRTAHGFHFGVQSCRACAAFFRRYACSKWVDSKCVRDEKKKKKRKPKPGVRNDFCLCRPCRLKQCMAIGMDTKNFQLDRGPLVPCTSSSSTIPQSLATFIGRPEYLMFTTPTSSKSKVFIDVHKLISEGSRLLNHGCETPILEENQLKKLALGSNLLKFDAENMKFFTKVGRTELTDIIEFYFLTVVKWIMRFDEFWKLDRGHQMSLLLSIWHIWMKIHKCSATAMFRKTNHFQRPRQKIFRNMCIDTEFVKVDTSWMSDYPYEYVNSYIRSQAVFELEIMESIKTLDPSDMELTYMFAQICFEYAGKRFQGEILKITDHFQQVLSDDLHKYYVEEEKNPRYVKRLGDLMKVNNMIQKSIWTSRPQRELNRVFNVLKIGFSHPDMFEDSILDSSNDL
ncbi:unnamed protein product [Caenorhabditis brenneri]